MPKNYFFSVWTDLIEYFLLKTGVLHATEKLHYFKITPRIFIDEEKTTNWMESDPGGRA